MYGGKFALRVCGGGGGGGGIWGGCCSYLEGLMHGGAYFLNFSVFDFTSIRSTWRACTQSENR